MFRVLVFIQQVFKIGLPMVVFVLQHVHQITPDIEDVKLIGVYSSLEMAETAKSRTANLKGFRDTPNGFYIDEYEIDFDHWAEGFVIVE